MLGLGEARGRRPRHLGKVKGEARWRGERREGRRGGRCGGWWWRRRRYAHRLVARQQECLARRRPATPCACAAVTSAASPRRRRRSPPRARDAWDAIDGSLVARCDGICGRPRRDMSGNDNSRRGVRLRAVGAPPAVRLTLVAAPKGERAARSLGARQRARWRDEMRGVADGDRNLISIRGEQCLLERTRPGHGGGLDPGVMVRGRSRQPIAGVLRLAA